MNEELGPTSGQRRKILFAGRVQGVGFRDTTRALARQLAVTGYVRNLLDGTVELVVEGETAELNRLMQAIARKMDGLISTVQVVEQTSTSGEFGTFEVRF